MATIRPSKANRSRKKFLKIKETPNGLWADHPFNNPDNHDNLLEYLKERINLSFETVNSLRDRFERIDRSLAGFLKLDKDDQVRRKNNLRGAAPTPTKAKPQIALAQLGRGVTYLASVFSPDSGIYEALTTVDEQSYANAVVRLMNQQSIKAKYFREQCKYFLNNLKYNMGCISVEWVEQQGYKVGSDTAGKAVPEPTVIYSGNYCCSRNMYNTFWDTSVHPTDVHSKGEFAGHIEMLTPFRAKALVEAGELSNMVDVLSSDASQGNRTLGWFRAVPDVRFEEGNATRYANGEINWDSILSARSIKGYESGGVELATICIWVLPNDFGLADPKTRKTRSKLEIWKICIANGSRIVFAEQLNNIHNYIPYFFSTPIEDDLGTQQMSVGETLLPFQDLGSFLLNTMIDSTRKNVWDMIIFDPSVIDFNAVGDDVAARIPIKAAGWGKDIRQAIWMPEKTLTTDKVLQQVQTLFELMEYIFPTRMLQQVADIERAVKDQVAAVVQASQRESWKFAKVLDDQAMGPARFVMHSNILQYQETIKVLMPDGTQLDLDPTKLRSMNLEYKIGEGLQTVDKLQKQLWIKELLGLLLSSGGSQDINVGKLCAGVSRMFGVEVDFAQYMYTPDELRQRAANQGVGKEAGGIVRDAANAQQPGAQ